MIDNLSGVLVTHIGRSIQSAFSSALAPQQDFSPPTCFACRSVLDIGFPSAIDKINEYAAMSPNWDCEGASRISPEAAARTRHALYALSIHVPAPEITANSNGTLSLEWETPAGNATIEIGKTRYSGYVKTRDAPTTYFARIHQDVDQVVGAVIGAILFKSQEPSAPVTIVHDKNAR